MSSRATFGDVAGHFGAILARLILIAVIVAAIGLLLGAMAIPGALAVNSLLGTVRDEVLDVPPLGEADVPPQNSYVYADDGSELAELTFEENRVPVALRDIPDVAIDAVLATEDANFYAHEGVNHLAIVRAALTNLQAGGIESGASTITQQYVKLAFLTPEQTLGRKIEEALYAIQIERELTKDEILERYLNRAYFGNGVYGIGTAAERYFSKDIGDIELGEAAMLAGLLRAPEANNPIRSEDNARARRDIVLGQMATHGFITRQQAQTAIAQPLVVDVSEPPPPANPFWVDWVARLLISEPLAQGLGSQLDALETMGASTEERRRRVFQTGLRIHTTLDPELQQLAEESIREHLTYADEPPEEVAREPMGALVSVEPGTGAIRALAMGPHEYGSCAEDGSWVGEDPDTGELLCDRTKVNVAVPGGGGSGRQPGSSFKPFLIAAALEYGISPGLTLDATGPQEIEGCSDGDGLWEVNNSGGNGIVDMYEAVARSSNVYHALLIADIGPERAAEMSGRLGVPIPDRDIYCPLALGATDTTPLEMAVAYATLANRGEHCAPFAITRIEDASGRTIWEHSVDCQQVIDTDIADRVIDLLAGPVEAGGTAPEADLGEWPTRGKTGTTNDFRDAWFTGFVRQLATAAWVGYPNGDRTYATQGQAFEVCGAEQAPICGPEGKLLDNVTIAGVYYDRVFGGTIPAPMWTTYMRQAVQRFEPEGFVDPGPVPSGVVPDLLQAGSVTEAEQLALEAGFRLETASVSHWRPVGTFVEQTPAAGTRLPLGNQILLGISDGTGDRPTIPNVIGMTVDQAFDVLSGAGYRVFRRDVDVFDEEQVGRVISMSPGPGTAMVPGSDSRVTINVGVLAEEPDPDPEDPDDGSDGPGEPDNGTGDPGPPPDPAPPPENPGDGGTGGGNNSEGGDGGG